jgi:hypothetical protein
MSVEAVKTGAIDFLPKPFRDQEMLDAVTGPSSAIESAATKRNRTRTYTGGLLTRRSQPRSASANDSEDPPGHVMRKMGAGSLADLVLIAERLGTRGQD